MFRGRFVDDVKAVPILPILSSAAATDRNSEVIDCLNAKKVVIALQLGVVHNSATQNSYLQHSDAVTNETTLNGGATVEGTSVTHAGTDDDNVILYEVTPRLRYLQLVINKDTSNAGNESAIAYVFPKDRPVTQAAGTATVGEGSDPVSTKIIPFPVTGTP